MTNKNVNAEPAPALELVFNGLFFLCFNTDGKPAVNDPAGECRIGFVTTAPQHKITITGGQINPTTGKVDKPDFDLPLEHAEARKIQVDLDVPGVASPSVTRRGHSGTINRSDDKVNVDYFKWIIDMENIEMHNTKLRLIRGVLKPVLHVNIGEFYTRELSEVTYKRTRVDTGEISFGKVAAITGVRIATLPQGKASLKVGASTYPLVAQPGMTYEVTFTNRCPKCDALDKQDRIDLHLSDFPHHYHAFDIDILEQYDFDFPPAQPAFPPAVCYAAAGSRTTDI
jgi:hypothetical protein